MLKLLKIQIISKKEVEEFKDGIYKKELMDRIELVKQHMYCKDKRKAKK